MKLLIVLLGQVACLAENTGGQYVRAGNATQLVAALKAKIEEMGINGLTVGYDSGTQGTLAVTNIAIEEPGRWQNSIHFAGFAFLAALVTRTRGDRAGWARGTWLNLMFGLDETTGLEAPGREAEVSRDGA